MSFLDKTGLAHLWNQIIARLNGKVEREEFDNLEASLTKQIENIDFSAYETTVNAQSKLDEAKSYTDTAASTKADLTHTHTIANVTNLQTALDEKVPTSRTVNGKALSSNITLSATDVGALPNTTDIPDALSDLTSDSTHRTVTDTEKATWNAKSDFSGSYNDLTNKPTIPSINGLATETYVDEQIATEVENRDSAIETAKSSAISTATATAQTKADTALASAKSYTDTKTSGLASTSTVDTKISTHNTSTSAHSDIRDLITGLTTRLNTLADSDDTTLDQMSEIVAYIKSNKDLIDSITTSKVNVSDIVNNLTTNVSNKPLSAAQGVAIKTLIDALDAELDSHTHAIADVSGLQSALDGKAASSHGTHVSYSTTAPVMDGTASVGSASTVARSDHKHPTDTSRASQASLDSHIADTTKHITSTERSNWNAAKTHADSAHAPSNAEKNQNAFSNITVGTTTVAADSATDTVTFAGSNVTITPDVTNDKITFSVADGSTSTRGIVQLTNSTSSTSTTTAATPSSVKSAYDLANTAKTAAATAQATADGKVPTSRTINGKALSSNITLSATDVGAAASSHTHDDRYYTEAEIDSKLAGKANSSHTHSISNVSGLQSALDGKSSTSHVHTSLMGGTDNREVATTPNDYNGVFMVAGLKWNDYIDSPSNDTYSGVIGFRQWVDVTGGKAHELAFNNSGLFMRSGETTSWGEWEKFITSANIGSQSVNYASSANYATSAGSASSATKATQDGSGNNIVNTYATKSQIPTKISQLTNDSGFKTTDNNTTYELTKSGSTITLTGSDGSTTSVTDSDTNTTYSLGSFGITATAAELNYTDGVTGNIQTQLNGKAASSHTHTKSQITDFPTSMPASDVYSWAKASSKPSYSWSEITSKPSTFTPASHTHNYAGSASAGGVANSTYSTTPVTTSGTGAAYTATVSGISSLTAGVSFVMVPHTVSTTTAPTLNVNGLGAKGIRRRLSNISTTVQNGYSNNWLGANQPFTVTYNGTYWIVEGNIKTASADLYGAVPISLGGTGATDAATARANLGITNVQTYKGEYYGYGQDGGNHTINCGFQPDVVFFVDNPYWDNSKSHVWVTSTPWMSYAQGEEEKALQLTSNGFIVDGGTYAYETFNEMDHNYYFVAVKFG